MGWSYKFWVGKLYPEGTKPTDYLAEYAKSDELGRGRRHILQDTQRLHRRGVEGLRARGLQVRRQVPPDGDARPRPRLRRREARRLPAPHRGPRGEAGATAPPVPALPQTRSPRPRRPARSTAEEPPHRRRVQEQGLVHRGDVQATRDHGVALASTNRAGAPEVDTAGFAYFRWEGDRKAVVAERGEVQVDRGAETAEWAAKVKRHLDCGARCLRLLQQVLLGVPAIRRRGTEKWALAPPVRVLDPHRLAPEPDGHLLVERLEDVAVEEPDAVEWHGDGRTSGRGRSPPTCRGSRRRRRCPASAVLRRVMRVVGDHPGELA